MVGIVRQASETPNAHSNARTGSLARLRTIDAADQGDAYGHGVVISPGLLGTIRRSLGARPVRSSA